MSLFDVTLFFSRGRAILRWGLASRLEGLHNKTRLKNLKTSLMHANVSSLKEPTHMH